MTELNDERWAFMVEWFDSSADLVRQYQLLYYLMDSTLEMSVPAFPFALAAALRAPRPRSAVGRASNPWARAQVRHQEPPHAAQALRLPRSHPGPSVHRQRADRVFAQRAQTTLYC